MALPEDHLAKFYKMTDAKEMWDAIKSRFGGNDESKKMQKYILKQQFEGFSVSNTEGLHKGYDRFQSLLSQLEIHGAGVSTEDANQKFLRSLSSAWSQVSLIMRTKPGVDSLKPVGFDKTKVECYNCHKTSHFTRECRIKGTQDDRRRDAWNSGNKDGSRTRQKEDFKASVTVDGEGVDWKNHSEDEDYALMACNSSDSDTEVISCSNKCKESYANLKKLYDAQREQLSYASIEIKAYSQGLKKVEAQLVAHQQGQLWYEQKIKFMKIDLDDKTDVLTYHKKLLAEAQIEKEDLKAKVEKWHNSSKNLSKLLNTQMSANDKFGLGYGDHRYDGILSYENEVLQSVFMNKESDIENQPVYDSTESSELVSEPVVMNLVLGCHLSLVVAPIIEEYKSDSEDDLNHLIRDCDFHEKRMARKADLNNGWNNVQRVNKQNQFVPSAVLTRTGKIPVSTARASREKGKLLLSPQQVVIGDHKDTMVDPNTMVDPVLEIDYPHRALKNKGIIDSGCSRHMTGNKAYLAEFQDFNGGPVAFGGSKGYITGKGKIKTGKLDFEDVCFVKELQHFNLFSVSQMCDKKNKVLFTDSECLVLSPEFKLPDENQEDLLTDDNVANLLTKAFDVSMSLRVIDGTEALQLPTLFILWLDKVSTDSAKLVPLGKVCTALETLKKNTAKGTNTMAVLDSCPKHNMVAYLEKSEGNAEFHEIIDFLKRSSIHHALTSVSILDASINEVNLFFDDAVGIVITTIIRLYSMHIKPFMGKSLFSFMVKKGKHFSGKVTPLFATMLVQPTQDEGASSERPSKAQPTPSPSPTSEVPYEPQSDLSPAHTSEQRFPRKSFSKKHRVHKESVSKQGRKFAKGESSVQRDHLFDEIPEDTVDHMEAENAQNEGRIREMVDEDKEIDKKNISTEEHNEGTEEKNEGTEENFEGTEEQVKSTDGHKNGTEEEIATQSTQTSTQTPISMIFGDDETITEKKFQHLESDESWLGKFKKRLRADRLLAEKIQEQEREQFTIEERAKFLHDTIAAQRKFLAQQRSEAIRNRPPTKSQLRNQMMTYLKHVGNFKHAELKIKKFEEVQALYEKIKRSDEDFISIGSAEDERLIKRMNEKGVDSSKDEMIKEQCKEEVKKESKAEVQEEIKEESKRKRKLGTRKKMKSRKRRYIQNTSEDDSDKENDELRLHLTIAPDEEKEVDYEILDRKYPIKEWKTECLGTKPQTDQAEHIEEINQNVVIRSNGQKRYFSTLMRVLSIFDREDLNAVYQLVMDRFQDEMPEGFHRVLWGDLMVLFNPDDKDEFWNSQLDWIIVSWKLHSSSGVHTLVTETGLVIHMLVEKKYPLRKEVLMQMLKLKLESEEDSTMALELIKFVKKILAELEPEEHKELASNKKRLMVLENQLLSASLLICLGKRDFVERIPSDMAETQSEAVKLLIFPFSLCDKAKTWFNELNEESITSWEQMRRAFINKFFPPSLFNRLLLEIRNFSQNKESIQIESHKSSIEHPIANDFVVINIPEEDVEPKQIILDPDDQPMWESAKTVAPTPNSAIVQPNVDDNFVINSTHLNMIRENKFDGYLRADPHEFLAICNMFRYSKTQSEAVKLMIFPLSLCDEAKTWFNELNEESITSWEQMRKSFINRFFPPSLFNRLLLKIRNFSHWIFEIMTEKAWLPTETCFEKCHGHGLTKGTIIQIFYHGLDEPT
ncbi:ribonuclease H-like domain-containing protein [Tanacetum coccineum]